MNREQTTGILNKKKLTYLEIKKMAIGLGLARFISRVRIARNDLGRLLKVIKSFRADSSFVNNMTKEAYNELINSENFLHTLLIKYNGKYFKGKIIDRKDVRLVRNIIKETSFNKKWLLDIMRRGH